MPSLPPAVSSAFRLQSSFRDPGGFLYRKEGTLYRQINHSYRPHFEQFLSSGLYEELLKEERIIPHEEAGLHLAFSKDEAFKILRPLPLSFVSYPYEWCFSGLKDAALLLLRLQKNALLKGLTLKDASAYNIQFQKGKPLLIDTLSFEIYRENDPWVAYRQFCEHFLAPLALMSFNDARLSGLFLSNPEGIPLDLAGKLLPWRSFFNIPLLLNLRLHAMAQKNRASETTSGKKKSWKLSKRGLFNLIENLETAILSLKPPKESSAWSQYHESQSYTFQGFQSKQEIVSRFLLKTKGETLWDLGANAGFFSETASRQYSHVLALDADPAATEVSYQKNCKTRNLPVLPLVINLLHPSPAVGWQNKETSTLEARGPADTLLALALIHHLAITGSVPLHQLAEFFSKTGRFLIIEFVPKSDLQVKRLLSSRTDIFPHYHRQEFERVFRNYFEIHAVEKVKESERCLYLMRKIA